MQSHTTETWWIKKTKPRKSLLNLSYFIHFMTSGIPHFSKSVKCKHQLLRKISKGIIQKLLLNKVMSKMPHAFYRYFNWSRDRIDLISRIKLGLWLKTLFLKCFIWLFEFHFWNFEFHSYCVKDWESMSMLSKNRIMKSLYQTSSSAVTGI